MYKEAADIYAEHGMFEPAARNYLKASMWSKAGKYFEVVKKYNDAALAYKDGGLYDDAFKFILR